jgi:hypothetical protein
MADDLFWVIRKPTEVQKQKTIVVMGAPRGGTSLVAATLRKLGIMMGDNLGHQHEDPLFRQEVPIHIKIATIKQRNIDYDVWGWKLPNNVYYIRELLPYLRNPYIVAIFRNPLSISRSSAERDGRIYELRLLSGAIKHTAKVAEFLMDTNAPAGLIAFESAVQDPHRFVNDLSRFIGLPGGETADAARIEAEKIVNKELGYVRF